MSLTVRAPAKVNLILRVVGVRADGYHLLESLMVPIALYDRVRLRSVPGGEIRLRCSDPALSDGEENLVWRAADLLRRRSRRASGLDIRLTKRVPSGAGLGGGSSDAAAVLRGLNQLWSLGLTVAELARIGATLGADVPFFVHGRPALVQGIGTRVRPLLTVPRLHLALLWPGFPISTRWVYQNLHYTPVASKPIGLGRLLQRQPKRLSDHLANDLEPVARRAHPHLDSMARRLEQAGAEGIVMTGSGSALLGLFPSRAGARRAARQLSQSGLWAVAADSLSESPAPRLSRS